MTSLKIPALLRSCSVFRVQSRLSSAFLDAHQSCFLSGSNISFRSFSTGDNFARYGSFKRHTFPKRKALFNIRREVGPEPLRHREIYPNWNYDVELYAFGARLGEDTRSDLFRQAFMHESYAQKEIERRKVLNIDEEQNVATAHQGQLADRGADVVNSYLPAICRFNFPFLPEEAIQLFREHIMKTSTMAHISRHLGTSDLIRCAELPPHESTLASTLLAVIGALAEECGTTRAQHFILDLMVTRLLDVDINEMFQPKSPMSVVSDILQREGRAEPESRLLRHCGASTPEAVYLIGIYSDKKLIGQSFGETLSIAEEMSARDTLVNFFETTSDRRPMIFGERAKTFNFQVWSQTPNLKLSDWTSSDCKHLLESRLTVQPHLEAPVKKRMIQ